MCIRDRIAQTRAALGLDQPLWHQFVVWVGNVVRGDFGVSLFNQMPVSQLLGQRIGATLSIAFFTILVAVMLSIPLGVLAAYRAGTWIDRLVMLFAVLAFSVPVFLVGYLLIYAFAIQLPWFPVQGYVRFGQSPADWLLGLVLPCVNLALVYIALVTRMTRATVVAIGMAALRLSLIHI